MRCLYCNKRLGVLRALRSDPFCNSQHRESYHEEQSRIYAERLLHEEQKVRPEIRRASEAEAKAPETGMDANLPLLIGETPVEGYEDANGEYAAEYGGAEYGGAEFNSAGYSESEYSEGGYSDDLAATWAGDASLAETAASAEAWYQEGSDLAAVENLSEPIPEPMSGAASAVETTIPGSAAASLAMPAASDEQQSAGPPAPPPLRPVHVLADLCTPPEPLAVEFECGYCLMDVSARKPEPDTAYPELNIDLPDIESQLPVVIDFASSPANAAAPRMAIPATPPRPLIRMKTARPQAQAQNLPGRTEGKTNRPELALCSQGRSAPDALPVTPFIRRRDNRIAMPGAAKPGTLNSAAAGVEKLVANAGLTITVAAPAKAIPTHLTPGEREAILPRFFPDTPQLPQPRALLTLELATIAHGRSDAQSRAPWIPMRIPPSIARQRAKALRQPADTVTWSRVALTAAPEFAEVVRQPETAIERPRPVSVLDPAMTAATGHACGVWSSADLQVPVSDWFRAAHVVTPKPPVWWMATAAPALARAGRAARIEELPHCGTGNLNLVDAQQPPEPEGVPAVFTPEAQKREVARPGSGVDRRWNLTWTEGAGLWNENMCPPWPMLADETTPRAVAGGARKPADIPVPRAGRPLPVAGLNRFWQGNTALAPAIKQRLIRPRLETVWSREMRPLLSGPGGFRARVWSGLEYWAPLCAPAAPAPPLGLDTGTVNIQVPGQTSLARLGASLPGLTPPAMSASWTEMIVPPAGIPAPLAPPLLADRSRTGPAYTFSAPSGPASGGFIKGVPAWNRPAEVPPLAEFAGGPIVGRARARVARNLILARKSPLGV
jgi:hypothetical protein